MGVPGINVVAILGICDDMGISGVCDGGIVTVCVLWIIEGGDVPGIKVLRGVGDSYNKETEIIGLVVPP